MLTIRDAQMQTMADTSPGRPMVAPCNPTWIEVRLVDADKRPVPGQRYRIRLPDSSLAEGVLDDEGKARFEGILQGQCSVCFPEIDSKEWKQVR